MCKKYILIASIISFSISLFAEVKRYESEDNNIVQYYDTETNKSASFDKNLNMYSAHRRSKDFKHITYMGRDEAKRLFNSLQARYNDSYFPSKL